MAKRRKTTKNPERQRLLKSIKKSIKYREKQGYIFNPEFKEKLERKRIKSLKEIKENISQELARQSHYVDPLTNKSMKGTEAKIYRRQIKSKIKKQRKEDFRDEYYQDVDEDYNIFADSDSLGFIEWIRAIIEQLPDVSFLKGGKRKVYDAQKRKLLSYIDDRLGDLTTEQAKSYNDYLKNNESRIVASTSVIHHSSDDSSIEACYNELFEILKGGALTQEEQQTVEELNEWYEDFEERF